MPPPTIIGLIADTHGLLRPQALQALAGCDRILHAGDIGDPAILAALARIAPVTVVRGNHDTAGWAAPILPTATLALAPNVTAYMLHDLAALDLDPAAAGIRVVVHGHNHKPTIQDRGGVLTINPGSAGPRRFTLPVSVARLIVSGTTLTPELITLAVPPRG